MLSTIQVHGFVFDTLVRSSSVSVGVVSPWVRYKRSHDLCPVPQLSSELLSTMETVATVTSPASQPSPAQRGKNSK